MIYKRKYFWCMQLNFQRFFGPVVIIEKVMFKFTPKAPLYCIPHSNTLFSMNNLFALGFLLIWVSHIIYIYITDTFNVATSSTTEIFQLQSEVFGKKINASKIYCLLNFVQNHNFFPKYFSINKKLTQFSPKIYLQTSYRKFVAYKD